MEEDGRGKAPEPVVAEAARRSTGPSPPRERGPRVPEHLPVVEEVIIPEPARLAPLEWRRSGEEISDKLDDEPVEFPRFCGLDCGEHHDRHEQQQQNRSPLRSGV